MAQKKQKNRIRKQRVAMEEGIGKGRKTSQRSMTRDAETGRRGSGTESGMRRGTRAAPGATATRPRTGQQSKAVKGNKPGKTATAAKRGTAAKSSSRTRTARRTRKMEI